MSISPEVLQRAVERYLAGEIVRDIAYSIGVPEPTLRFQIKKLGVSRPHLGHGPKRKLSEEQRQIIAARYRAGEKISDLSRAFVIPKTSIQRELERCGVDLRPSVYHRRLTRKEKTLILEQYESGATYNHLAATLNISKQTVGHVLRMYEIALARGRRPRVCSLDESVFDEITAISARWMGFLFADGCLPRDSGQQAISLNISAKDREHLMKLRSFFGSTHAITDTWNKERIIDKNKGIITPAGPAVFYKVRSKRLSDALIRRGMIKEKGPERTPTAELEDVPAFWAGAVDGDGSIGNSNHRGRIEPYIMLCGHMPLLIKFQAFLVRHRLANLNITPTESGIFHLQTSGSTALRIIELLYSEDSAAAGLERKVLRSRQILRGEQVELYEGPVVATFEDDDV